MIVREFISAQATEAEREAWLREHDCFILVGHVVRWEVFRTLGQVETIRQVEEASRAQTAKRRAQK